MLTFASYQQNDEERGALKVMNEQYNTPILFLIFNRPEITRNTFKKIRELAPTQLFIAADGPRPDRAGEELLCQQTRSIIQEIDWPCTVTTLFREDNLGCGKAVSQAISWFFQHVEQGIILEDDCVPDNSFFRFCATLLERYQHDERVMMISGTNFLFNKITSSESYFFSRCYPIWGWATWRRAWQQYDFEIKDWSPDDASFLHQAYANKTARAHWHENFEKIRMGTIDTWDIQWAYACLKNNGYALIPYTNLVSNVGLFGAHANGQKSYFHEMPVGAICSDNLVYPARIACNTKMDEVMYRTIFKVTRPQDALSVRFRKILRSCAQIVGLR